MSTDSQPSTIAVIDADTGRMVDHRPLAYLVVWGARNERRAVVLEQARAEEIAGAQHGQVGAAGGGPCRLNALFLL